VTRQVAGTSSIVARVTGFVAGASANALAGVMIRETNFRGARRALLAVKSSGALEWHTRSTLNGSDTSVSGGTVTLPAWLKIERVGDVLTAFRASDAGGAPDTWTQVGTALTLTTLPANLDAGITATNATANTVMSATIDGVALTPTPSGPALMSEDVGSGIQAGSSSVSGSTYTINGSGTLGDAGHFRFQQFVGDVTVTARIVSHTASGQAAKGGVMIRDASLDSAPHGMMGIAHYWGGYFTWRNVIGGATGTNYGGATTNPQWIRLVREGDLITAWKAVNATGNVPGPWVKQGATQIFSARAPIYVGLAVDANSTAALNAIVLDNFTVVPGNLAPIVDAGPGGTVNGTSVAIDATVTDDGEPNPPGAFASRWSLVSGPGTVTFANENAVDTTATFSAAGTYVLRLTATDGEVSTFAETTYVVSGSVPPTVATQPTSQQANAGSGFTLSVTPGGTGPFTYQWRKDGAAIAGATDATYMVTSAQENHAGVYTVAIANAGGTTISNAVFVGVVPAGTAVAHAATTAYSPGTPLAIANTVTYPGSASALEWSVTLPAGWSLASDTASGTAARPAAGATGVLTWSWTTVPASPLSFSYAVNIPADQAGLRTIAAPVNLKLTGPMLQLLASPDPLVVLLARHSADYDLDGKISLAELLRVIELYNYRAGSVRTGQYTLKTGTEDGFTTGPGGGTLTRFHSGDTDRDGKLSLAELLRVIELYNYRAGSVRTGQYRVLRAGEAATDDGFAPGS
jgi:uncharacterized repeat protein (TIGR01451 family)